jgi:hypothetical protein
MIRSSGAYLGGRSGIYPVGGGSNTDPDAQAVINQMTSNGSTPSEARQTLINQLVLDLKGLGNTGSDDVWSRLDILNIHAAEDAIQSQTQWINADGTYDSVQVGTPTFTADVGFSSTNVANRIDPIWNAATGLGNYTQNNASVIFYGIVTNQNYVLSSADYRINFRAGLSNVDNGLNNPGFPLAIWGVVGDNLYVLDRIVSTEFKGYVNTSLAFTTSATSSTLTAGQVRYPYSNSFSVYTHTAKIVAFGASIRDVLPQLKASFDAYLAGL